MFERFTERARQVVLLAQQEARALKHNYIGSEHILLGLLGEGEGIAAQVLGSLNVNIGSVRAQVVRIVGHGEEVIVGDLPFTPRGKKNLELALREARSLGHNYIGTEHVLLGLVRENEGVSATILADFGVDPETIRDAVVERIGCNVPGVQIETSVTLKGGAKVALSHATKGAVMLYPGLADIQELRAALTALEAAS